MIPEAVRQLRLCSAFKGFAAHVMDCVSSSDDIVVYVKDNDTTHISELVTSNDHEDAFVGHNPKQTNICLLAIDHKLVNNHSGGIADCAVFNTDVFCFVEFKTNAQGRTLVSVESTYESAISQIENTLQIFESKMKEVEGDLYKVIDVVCHIVVSPKFPRNMAMEQNYMVAFATKWKMELSFENNQAFS